MKNVYCLFILNFICVTLSAQNNEQSPYLKNPVLPEFRILQKDSLTWFTKKDLKPGKHVMIMLFSPDCEHCQEETNMLQANKKQLGDLQIVMITYWPLDKMRKFYKDYKIAQNPNIKMGRDVPYFFAPFYKARSMPFMAIYNKQQKLVRVYDGGAKIDKILEALKL